MSNSSLPSNARHLRFEALDGLRGMAAFIVMLFHYFVRVDGLHGFTGYLAVDFFLVLSGFVISHAYYSKPLHFTGFVRNRLARMWPMHAAIVILLAGGVFAMEGELHTRQLVTKLTLTNNMGMGPYYHYYNTPAWTVSVELWCNVLFALLYLAIPSLRTSLTRLVVVCGGIALACFSILFVWYGHLDAVLRDFVPGLNYGFLRCLGSFALGLIVHRVYILYGDQLRSNLKLWHGMVLGLAFLALLFNPVAYTRWDFLSVIAFPLIVLYFATARNRVTDLAAAFRYLGKISFSLYLVHWPISNLIYLGAEQLDFTLTLDQPVNLVFANIIAISASLGSAILINRYFEDPVYRLLRQRHGTSGSLTVAKSISTSQTDRTPFSSAEMQK